MSATQKLSPTQTDVLRLATDRPDGNIEPLPPALRGGARKKVIDGLLARSLVVAQAGHYVLTDAGFAAVGCKRHIMSRKRNKLETVPYCRENTKQATIIKMLRQPEGATVSQIMAATGWQAHTVRGTFAGAFKKRLGLSITSSKSDQGERVYHVA
jgi:hypothetical protein